MSVNFNPLRILRSKCFATSTSNTNICIGNYFKDNNSKALISFQLFGMKPHWRLDDQNYKLLKKRYHEWMTYVHPDKNVLIKDLYNDTKACSCFIHNNNNNKDFQDFKIKQWCMAINESHSNIINPVSRTWMAWEALYPEHYHKNSNVMDSDTANKCFMIQENILSDSLASSGDDDHRDQMIDVEIAKHWQQINVFLEQGQFQDIVSYMHILKFLTNIKNKK